MYLVAEEKQASRQNPTSTHNSAHQCAKDGAALKSDSAVTALYSHAQCNGAVTHVHAGETIYSRQDVYLRSQIYKYGPVDSIGGIVGAGCACIEHDLPRIYLGLARGEREDKHRVARRIGHGRSADVVKGDVAAFNTVAVQQRRSVQAAIGDGGFVSV